MYFFIVLLTILPNIFGNPLGGRIIGGIGVTNQTFPYQVSIKMDGDHHCGGAIINPNYILTAAHCIDMYEDEEMIVHAGTNRLNETNRTYKVTDKIKHPEYYALKHDIGLLRVEPSIKFSFKIRPVNLPQTYTHSNITARLTGWGLTNRKNDEPPNDLQMINLTTISNSKCSEKVIQPGMEVYDFNLCTFTKKGEGICTGDSGGPLVANNEVIGIVSWARPWARGRPDVFTRVSYYVDWIYNNIS